MARSRNTRNTKSNVKPRKSKSEKTNIDSNAIESMAGLRKRIFFVIMCLVVFRFGTYVPMPGINVQQLAAELERFEGGVFGLFNLFSGGSLGRMTIFALSIMPYITVSIVIQLLSVILPSLKELKKEGERGKQKINQYTRYGTVAMASFQAFAISRFLESSGLYLGEGMFYNLTTVVTLVGGTMFLVWLGEQMTSRGIGNGISLLIYAGIVAELPGAVSSFAELSRNGSISSPMLIGVILAVMALILLVIYVERAQRRITVQYPKQQTAQGGVQGNTSHLPLKVNTAGVIPPIFASSLLLFPTTISGFAGGAVDGSTLDFISLYMGHGKPLYIAMYVVLITFFCFFYTKNVFNADDTAENLKKSNAFIAGIRPGARTADYLNSILARLTFVAALYLSLVCVFPEVLISKYSIPFYLGGTSLLIMVNVVIDTFTQIQSHMFAMQYSSILKKSRLRG